MSAVSPIRLLSTLLVVAVAVTVATATGALAQAGNDIDCSLDSTGKTPIIDLGSRSYEGAEGGLYPGGSNEIPAAHEALGLLRASEITPRDADGNPDPDGVIVFAAIGVSNTRREFTAFLSTAGVDPDIAESVVLVNGAQTGEPVSSWLDPDDSVWSEFQRELANAGVTAAQVQAAWVKVPERYTEQPPAFPTSALSYRDKLAAALRTMHDQLPNLEVAYLSSRIYGGYNEVTSSNPEPVAYEEGFGVKWLIEQQMAGNPVVNADPRQGEVESPWVAWGPYLWADGATPRSDGLTWECDDLNADGVHPNSQGSAKVADLLMSFLETEPTATWLFGDPVEAGDPPPPASVTTTTIPGDAGLTESALPIPSGSSGGPGTGDPGTVDTTPPGSPGAGPGADPEAEARRERRQQEREERLEERRERQEGTSSTLGPENEGTGAGRTGSTLAAGPTGDGDDVPPVVWGLAGAGVLMLVILLVRAVWERFRGEDPTPPDAA